MKRRALLIGLNNYPLLGELKYARQDAEAFGAALQKYCGFGDRDITLMTCQSEKALLGFSLNIERALRNLADCRDLDLLVFGFWGHGFSPVPGRRYLCGIDTIEDELERSAVSLDVVKGKLMQVQAENTLLVLNCCQNQTSSRGTAEPMTKGEERALAGIARDIQAGRRKQYQSAIPTVAVLNACCEGQKAYEWDSRGHGIFTAYLLDAFEQGYNGIAQIASWTAEQVSKTALEIYGQKQIPYITIEGKGDIELVHGSQAPLKREKPCSQLSRLEIVTEPALQIDTVPTGAAISVHGVEVGCAPLKLTLSAGEYRIRAEKYGYKPWEMLIRFDGAGDARLPIKLEERPKLAKAYFPMTAEEAAEVQRAVAEALGVPLRIEEDLGSGVKLKMILIPPGRFIMGSPQYDHFEREYDLQEEFVNRAFYLGIYPVTQEQWEAKMGENPSYEKGKNFPLNNISYYDIQEFINILNVKCRSGFRLPSDVEWEYSCRAGSDKERYGDIDDIVMYEKKTGQIHSVGNKLPNGFGLFDMLGNVREWVEFEKSYDGIGILRGGDYYYYYKNVYVRAASRIAAELKCQIGGFRLAKDL